MTEPDEVDGGVDVKIVCAVNKSGLANQHVSRQAGVGEGERRETEQVTTEENYDDRLALLDQDALKREFWAIMEMAVPVAATGTLQIMYCTITWTHISAPSFDWHLNFQLLSNSWPCLAPPTDLTTDKVTVDESLIPQFEFRPSWMAGLFSWPSCL